MRRAVRSVATVVAGVVLLGVPGSAQSPTRDVAFDGFAFSLPEAIASSVNITIVPGEAPGTETGPLAPILPATAFSFYDASQQPKRGGAKGELRLIPVSAIQERDFEGGRLDDLLALLEEQPELDPLSDSPPENLPVLPDVGAAQLIIGKAGYAASDTMSGVVYLTAFGQDLYPFTSRSFSVLFQGLSADGETWVALWIPVRTDLFPDEVSDNLVAQVTTSRGWPRYVADARTTLAEAPPDAFTPSLTAIGELIGSMSFTESASTP